MLGKVLIKKIFNGYVRAATRTSNSYANAIINSIGYRLIVND